MAPKARGLGKGLDSLIPISTEEVKAEPVVTEAVDSRFKTVDINLINPDRNQPRTEFDREKLEELADSIKQHGLIEPITVQKKKDHYVIIAGERRWRASKIAGLKEVPIIVGDYTEKEISEIQLIENIQREDLNAIEEALGYKRLMTEHGLTQEEVAKRVSKNRTTIANSLRLLKLNDKVQQMIIERKISEGHARALIGITDENKQIEIAEKIVKENLSVRDVEKLVKSGDMPLKPGKKAIPEDLDIFYKDAAEKMKQKLGTKVTISGKGDGAGKIEIEFYSNDDLDRIRGLFK